MSETNSEPVISLDRSFLTFMIDGGRAFTNPPDLLGDIKAEDAVKTVEGSSHTIATIISHLDYWQKWFLDGVNENLKDYPESLGGTFFPVKADAWQDLRNDFLNDQAKIKDLCSDATLLERPFSMGAELGGGHDKRSVGMTLMYSVILHNAHHYGQIITLRQLMGTWPPANGGIS